MRLLTVNDGTQLRPSGQAASFSFRFASTRLAARAADRCPALGDEVESLHEPHPHSRARAALPEARSHLEAAAWGVGLQRGPRTNQAREGRWTDGGLRNQPLSGKKRRVRV